MKTQFRSYAPALLPLLALGAALGLVANCRPEPPPSAEDLIDIQYTGAGTLRADGQSQLQIVVQLPVGATPRTVKLSTADGTLDTAEVRSDPELSTAIFFLTAGTKVGQVRLTAQVDEFTNYADLLFTRSCPTELQLSASDVRIAANGNNSTQLTARAIRTDGQGQPSQGLRIAISAVRETPSATETAGILTPIDSPVTGSEGTVKANLRAGQHPGTILVTASASCFESEGALEHYEVTLPIEFTAPSE